MKRYLPIIAGLCLLLSFAVLSKYEDRNALRNLDFAVTVKVQEKIDRSAHLRTASIVGNVMEGATFFASPEFTVVITLLLTGIVLYDRKNKRIRWGSLAVPFILVLIVAAEIVGKSVVHHPSPPFSMIKHPVSVFPADYVNEQYSYPSGHAARAVYLALAAYFFAASGWGVRRRAALSTVLLAYVVTVSVSRIYLGHHWFSDVIGGLFLGSGITLLFVRSGLRARENAST